MQSCRTLCTLVIARGTFHYALRAVAAPWSPDQGTTTSIIYRISDAITQRITKASFISCQPRSHGTGNLRSLTRFSIYLLYLEKEITSKNRNVPALHTKERAQLTLLLNYLSIDRANLIVNFRDFATRVAGLGCDPNTRVYAAGQKPPAKSCVRPLVGLDVRCP
jgi:hypothetical protein